MVSVDVKHHVYLLTYLESPERSINKGLKAPEGIKEQWTERVK